jgi:hypothetical protein
MNDVMHSTEPRAWAEEHFGDLPFSNVRRSERAITIATAMASNPGASIPQLFAHSYETKAAYTFFAHPEAEPDTLQTTHRSLVAEQMESQGTYLLLEDTTELDWTGRERIPGLGPIGNSTVSTQGVILHTVLGVRWPDGSEEVKSGRRPAITVLGVCDQQYHIRVPRRPEERRGDSWHKKKRERESQIWQRASERMGVAPEHVRWVRIGDAAADIYEHLTTCRALGYGFVIRSGQDRAVVDSEGRSRGRRLYETARAAVRLGQFTVELPARKGARARVATLSISVCSVRLRSPQRPGAGAGQLPPVPCTMVRVWEEQPATPGEMLEWILLCDAPVLGFAQAHTCTLQYATRWVIECYHKSLKQNVSLAKSPPQTVTTQTQHFCAALCGFIKLERLNMRTQLNPFTLKAKLSLNALHSAFAILRALRSVQASA